jgi:tetratricopeptide (TPR) repeat protein
LTDFDAAKFSYTKALELQNQHQAPNHPLTSEIYIKVGNLFEKEDNVSAALESYEKAIGLGSPNTASEAYEVLESCTCIGEIMMWRVPISLSVWRFESIRFLTKRFGLH